MKDFSFFKRSTAIAALILSGMALSQARANPVITTFLLGSSPAGPVKAGGNPTNVLTYTVGGLSITATGYDCHNAPNNLCADATTTDYSTHAANLYQNTDGLGMTDNPQNVGGVTKYEIPNWQFVQFNFSAVMASNTITSIQFKMVDINTGWALFSSSHAGELQGATGVDITDSSSSTSLQTITSPTFSLYSFIAAEQCDTVLNEIILTTTSTGGGQGTVPEPATLVMTGLALVGLAAIIKKTRKQA